MRLLDPIAFGAATARNSILFGPHVTNLGGEDRQFTDRHLHYYLRRADGGCGTIVLEQASVDPSDWPYERAPLADRAATGWARIAERCHDAGALVIAGLNHAGGQGSSAYSQLPLWAPSRVPEVATREVPKWMEADDIAAVVTGFGAAAKLAIDAGCDGVELNAGQHSLIRQFLSGLTNHRDDAWGQDRTRFARDVITTVDAALPASAVLGLRLCCDELAPWAGITPEQAPGIAASLVAGGAVDYVVVERGSIFSVEQTRPDFHMPAGFNRDLCAAIRLALPAGVTVVLQGSIVDPAMAEAALGHGTCDAVELTRAQIADPQVAAKLAGTVPGAVRPCILCNQACQVRDARNPIVSCVGEPTSGHEHEDPDWYRGAERPRNVLVVGAGPAGLETARVAARRGHRPRVVERHHTIGGTAAIAGPGAALVAWLEAELQRLGVEIVAGSAHAEPTGDEVVVQCTGSIAGPLSYTVDDDAAVLDVRDLRAGEAKLPANGLVAVIDPIGGPIAVALAEELGDRAVLVTADNVAGNELARTGDLAPANVRLHQRGVRIERRTLPRAVRRAEAGLEVEVEDRFTGGRRVLAVAAVVDCGFRMPAEPLAGAHLHAGDCVAPRTILEAVLEGRRAALAIDGV
jgi:mycofactocin system FadH/OYE family oxidoreductase 1